MNCYSYNSKYCANFSQIYFDSFLNFLIKKKDFTEKDINCLILAISSNNPCFKNAQAYIFKNFKEIDEKITKFLSSWKEDEIPDIQEIYIFHLNLAILRYGILFPKWGVHTFIQVLSRFEIERMDEFALSYVEERGLHRNRFKNIRSTTPYYTWTQQVKIKDSFTCQRCGAKTDVVAHHITPVKKSPELATDVNNGITLCNKCHKLYHSGRGLIQCNAESLSYFIDFYKERNPE